MFGNDKFEHRINRLEAKIELLEDKNELLEQEIKSAKEETKLRFGSWHGFGTGLTSTSWTFAGETYSHNDVLKALLNYLNVNLKSIKESSKVVVEKVKISKPKK